MRTILLLLLATAACTDHLETSDVASSLESRQIDAMNVAATGTGINYVLHEDTWQAPDLELRLSRVPDLLRTIVVSNDVDVYFPKMMVVDASTLVDLTAGGLELTATLDTNLALRDPTTPTSASTCSPRSTSRARCASACACT